MAVKKKSGARRRSKNTRSSTRFWSALLASALSSFQIASCSLDPNWNSQLQQQLSELPFWQQTPHAQPAAPQGQRVATRFAACPQFFPSAPPVLNAAPASLRELCFDTFAILHSASSKTPVFVVERLSRNSLQLARQQSRSDRFYAEARLPAAERAELSDYKGSGYSRGHMAPAADMASPQAMAQSFSLANMVPQERNHNSGPWAKIEEDTRRYVLHRAQAEVYVFTGPVFASPRQTIGRNQVQVPSHLFKLVYDPGTGRSWAHWQANASQPQNLQPISYQELVARTGLHLIPALEAPAAQQP
jgi:endonuclease G